MVQLLVRFVLSTILLMILSFGLTASTEDCAQNGCLPVSALTSLPTISELTHLAGKKGNDGPLTAGDDDLTEMPIRQRIDQLCKNDGHMLNVKVKDYEYFSFILVKGKNEHRLPLHHVQIFPFSRICRTPLFLLLLNILK